MKKYKLVVLILFVVLVVVAFSIGFYYKYQISPVSRESEKVIVEIKSGSISSIGDTLYENNLIRSKFIFKIYVKLNGVDSLKASTYELDKNMKLSEIIDVLEEVVTVVVASASKFCNCSKERIKSGIAKIEVTTVIIAEIIIGIPHLPFNCCNANALYF